MIDQLLRIWPLVLGGILFCSWAAKKLIEAARLDEKNRAEMAALTVAVAALQASVKSLLEHYDLQREKLSGVTNRLAVVETRQEDAA